MEKWRPRLSYANVIATLALFIALGGGAYAATKLPNNSIGTKQLKKGAVTGQKVAGDTLTGANINSSTLGTVPSAIRADNAGSANHATTADSATFADHATAATSAESASSATNAGQLGGIPASGYQSRTMWARVGNGGEVIAQSGGVSLQEHAGTGLYLLHFPQVVAGKAIVVSGRWTGAAAGHSLTFLATPCGLEEADCSLLASNTASDLFIEATEAGTVRDASFYVTVIP
jgi:hypothetical protein